MNTKNLSLRAKYDSISNDVEKKIENSTFNLLKFHLCLKDMDVKWAV